MYAIIVALYVVFPTSVNLQDPPLAYPNLLGTKGFVVVVIVVVNLQDRDSYWKMMNKYIGSDVMSVITLLIIIFELLGKWQRFVLVSSGLEF